MSNRFLEGRKIAVSISDSPDLPHLGLRERHLRDIMVELARHLISAGATLIYGGDLRQHGYTELLFEVAVRYHNATADHVPSFTNWLPWPTHLELSPNVIKQREEELGEHATLVRLARDGTSIPRDEIVAPTPALTMDWIAGLTSMRMRATEECDARIALGGPVEKYRGRMPGIAEEVLLALEAKKPSYLIGGFGGCAADICEELGLTDPRPPGRQWKMRKAFAEGSGYSLRNGLTPEDCRRLARTVHTDEVVTLILRGLHRLVRRQHQ
jgi:hypothetical protein